MWPLLSEIKARISFKVGVGIMVYDNCEIMTYDDMIKRGLMSAFFISSNSNTDPGEMYFVRWSVQSNGDLGDNTHQTLDSILSLLDALEELF